MTEDKLMVRLARTKRREQTGKIMKSIVAAGMALAFAGAAHADDAFGVGAVIKSIAGDTDPVCSERADTVAYSSANDACAFGSAGDCDAAKRLETSGKCGAHHAAYVVLEADGSSGLIRISPKEDRSVSYWAFSDDFSPSR